MDTRLAIAFERTHIPDQSLLRSIQSVLRAMLGLDSVIGQAVPGGRAQEARNEQIYEDLMATGDRLLSLLRSEFEAIPVDPNQAPSDTINRWRACRRSIDHLVE